MLATGTPWEAVGTHRPAATPTPRQFEACTVHWPDRNHTSSRPTRTEPVSHFRPEATSNPHPAGTSRCPGGRTRLAVGIGMVEGVGRGGWDRGRLGSVCSGKRLPGNFVARERFFVFDVRDPASAAQATIQEALQPLAVAALCARNYGRANFGCGIGAFGGAGQDAEESQNGNPNHKMEIR